MQMPEGYQVPDDPDAGRMDASYLRTCLGIPTPLSGKPLELPLSVRRAHFLMSHALRRMGAMGRTGMDATQIAAVVAIAGMGEHVEPPAAAVSEPPQPEPVHQEPRERTFVDDVNDGLVDKGDEVIFRHRAEDHVGTFSRLVNGQVVVLHDGTERRCYPSAVRIAATSLS